MYTSEKYRKKIKLLVNQKSNDELSILLNEIDSQQSYNKVDDLADFLNDAIKKNDSTLIDLYCQHLSLFKNIVVNDFRSMKNKYSHPACVAIKENNLYALDKIIHADFDINHKVGIFDNLLHYAVMQNNIDAVKMLLDNGININHRNNLKNTPLHVACMKKNQHDIVALLIERKADIYLTNSADESILYKAIESKSQRIFDLVFQNLDSLSIDKANRNNKTPLHYAIIESNGYATDKLLDISDLKKENNYKSYFEYMVNYEAGFKNIKKYLLLHGKCISDIYFNDEHNEKERSDHVSYSLSKLSDKMTTESLDKITILYLKANSNTVLRKKDFQPLIKDVFIAYGLNRSLLYFIKNCKSLKDMFNNTDNFAAIIAHINNLPKHEPLQKEITDALWNRVSKMKDRNFINHSHNEKMQEIASNWIAEKECATLKNEMKQHELSKNLTIKPRL